MPENNGLSLDLALIAALSDWIALRDSPHIRPHVENLYRVMTGLDPQTQHGPAIPGDFTGER